MYCLVLFVYRHSEAVALSPSKRRSTGKQMAEASGEEGNEAMESLIPCEFMSQLQVKMVQEQMRMVRMESDRFFFCCLTVISFKNT
jgi:hypothetical protein